LHAMHVFHTGRNWKPRYGRQHNRAIRGTQMTDLLFALGFDDLLAAIKPVGADVMAQVRFARSGLYREWRIGQEIMRPVHTAF
jgi:hypothetical protein